MSCCVRLKMLLRGQSMDSCRGWPRCRAATLGKFGEE